MNDNLLNKDYRDMVECLQKEEMDRTIVKKTTLKDQDEAFCLALSLDDRLRVLEELNRQGRVLAGYAATSPLDRKAVRVSVY